jgi:hypothetical protein
MAGVCAFHLREFETWWGQDGPGVSRKYEFKLQVAAKDNSGTIVGGTGTQSVVAGDGAPYRCKGFYEEIVMTPEAQGGDYIQFSIGSQSWTTKDSGTVPGCSVGGWDFPIPLHVSFLCFEECGWIL